MDNKFHGEIYVRDKHIEAQVHEKLGAKTTILVTRKKFSCFTFLGVVSLKAKRKKIDKERKKALKWINKIIKELQDKDK